MRSMIERATRPVLCGLACALICAPVLALSPVEGEVGAVYWANQTDSTTSGGNVSTHGATPGLRGDLWVLDRYGVRAGQYRAESNDDGVDTTSVDVMWRAFAPSAHNFLAIGLGWQDMQFHGANEGGDTSGMRLSVEGHVGFTDLIQGYGQGAWLPRLDDSANAAAELQDMDGYEYEMGVAWSAAPFLSVRAGWRGSSLGFTETTSTPAASSLPQAQPKSGGNQGLMQNGSGSQQGQSVGSSSGTTESKGWFFGLGFRF
jgi:hypothetical protein